MPFCLPFKHLQMISSNHSQNFVYDRLKIGIIEQLSSFNYHLELEYYDQKWSVEKGIFDFLSLYSNLKKHGIYLNGFGRHRIVFASNPQLIGDFVKDAILKTKFLDIPEVYRFFEISKYSFFGKKEFDYVFDVKIEEMVCCGCLNIFDSSHFIKMFVCLKGSMLLFICYSSNQTLEVIFIDKTCKIVLDEFNPFIKAIKIIHDSRSITIKSSAKSHIKRLYSLLKQEKDIIEQHRFNSFAQSKKGNSIQFFVDGKNYFEDLYNKICSSKEQIFIAGWWVYPKLYLKREFQNGKLNKKFRIDRILERKAKEGVKIYVLVYKENRLALPNDSYFTERVLTNLHSNIKVIRHPFFTTVGLIYWSHHEKIVVIDQKIAYIGGLDIALGRYDTAKHVLFDYQNRPKSERRHESREQKKRTAAESRIATKNYIVEKVYADKNQKSKSNHQPSAWPGMDFSNPLKNDFVVGVHDEKQDIINRKKTPRMPWHDVHVRIEGESVFEVGKHFIQRWNYAAKTCYPDEIIVPIKKLNIVEDEAEVANFKITRELVI